MGKIETLWLMFKKFTEEVNKMIKVWFFWDDRRQTPFCQNRKNARRNFWLFFQEIRVYEWTDICVSEACINRSSGQPVSLHFVSEMLAKHHGFGGSFEGVVATADARFTDDLLAPLIIPLSTKIHVSPRIEQSQIRFSRSLEIAWSRWKIQIERIFFYRFVLGNYFSIDSSWMRNLFGFNFEIDRSRLFYCENPEREKILSGMRISRVRSMNRSHSNIFRRWWLSAGNKRLQSFLFTPLCTAVSR